MDTNHPDQQQCVPPQYASQNRTVEPSNFQNPQSLQPRNSSSLLQQLLENRTTQLPNSQCLQQPMNSQTQPPVSQTQSLNFQPQQLHNQPPILNLIPVEFDEIPECFRGIRREIMNDKEDSNSEAFENLHRINAKGNSIFHRVLQSKQSAVKILSEKLLRKDEEVILLKEQCRAKEVDKQNALSHAQSLQDELERVKQKLSEAESKNTDLGNEINVLKQQCHAEEMEKQNALGLANYFKGDSDMVRQKLSEAEENITELGRKLNYYNNTIQSSNAENAMLSNQNTKLNKQVNDLQKNEEDLNKEVESLNNLQRKTNEEKKKLEEQVEDSEKKLTSSSDELKEVKMELSEQTLQLTQLKSELKTCRDDLGKEKQKLLSKLQNFSDWKKKLTIDVTILTTEKDGFESANKILTTEKQDLEEKVRNFETEKKKSTETIQAYEHEANNDKKKITGLENTILIRENEIKNSVGKEKNLELKVKDYENQLQSLETLVKKLEGEKKGLELDIQMANKKYSEREKKLLKNRDEVATELQKYKELFASQKKEYEQNLATANAATRNNSLKITQLEAELVTAKTNVDIKSECITKLKNMTKDLDRIIADSKKNIVQLNSQLDILSGKNTELHLEIKSVNKTRIKLSLENGELTKEVEQHKLTIESQSKKLLENEDCLIKKCQEIANQLGELSYLKAKISDFENLAKETAEKLTEAEKDLKYQLKGIAYYKDIELKLAVKLSVQKDMEKIHQNIANSTIKKHEQTIEEMKQRSTELDGKIDALEKTITKRDEKITEMETTITKSNEELKEMAKTMTELNEKIEELENSRTELKAKMKELKDTVPILANKIHTEEKAVERLEKKHRCLHSKLDELLGGTDVNNDEKVADVINSMKEIRKHIKTKKGELNELIATMELIHSDSENANANRRTMKRKCRDEVELDDNLCESESQEEIETESYSDPSNEFCEVSAPAKETVGNDIYCENPPKKRICVDNENITTDLTEANEIDETARESETDFENSLQNRSCVDEENEHSHYSE